MSASPTYARPMVHGWFSSRPIEVGDVMIVHQVHTSDRAGTRSERWTCTITEIHDVWTQECGGMIMAGPRWVSFKQAIEGEKHWHFIIGHHVTTYRFKAGPKGRMIAARRNANRLGAGQ